MRAFLPGLIAAALIGAGVPASAVGTDDPAGGSRFGTQSAPTTSGSSKTAKPPTKPRKPPKSSSENFLDGYRAARALVQAGHYEEAIAAFRALGQDDHADVANYLGFASRKLGRYEDARVWYERALAADPAHVRTWQYYGMWHLEQGNMLKAQDHLLMIKAICGSDRCEEYRLLQEGIDGRISY
jgi:TolA-binding protein